MSAIEPAHSALASRLMRRVPAIGLVLTSMTMFQLGAVLATQLFDSLGPAGATLLRLGWAAVIMAALWYPFPWPLSREQVRAVLFFGVVLGTMNLCFYEAIDRMAFGTTIAIQFTGPLTVAAVGRRRMSDLIWVACAALGIVALLSPGAGDVDPTGVLFASISAVAWAGYILGSARLGRTFTDTRGLALGMAVACLVPLVPGVWSASHGSFGVGILAIGIVVALLSSVLPHTFDTEALRRLPSNVFGTLMALEPVMGAVLGAIFLSQSPTWQEAIGILLVVAAAVGVMRGHVDMPIDV